MKARLRLIVVWTSTGMMATGQTVRGILLIPELFLPTYDWITSWTQTSFLWLHLLLEIDSILPFIFSTANFAVCYPKKELKNAGRKILSKTSRIIEIEWKLSELEHFKVPPQKRKFCCHVFPFSQWDLVFRLVNPLYRVAHRVYKKISVTW